MNELMVTVNIMMTKEANDEIKKNLNRKNVIVGPRGGFLFDAGKLIPQRTFLAFTGDPIDEGV